MDSPTTGNGSNDTISLEQQAAELFPYPASKCPWLRRKIDWKRDKWVKEKSLQPKS